MKVKLGMLRIAVLVYAILGGGFAVRARATGCDPPCGDCKVCEEGECVEDNDQDWTGGDTLGGPDFCGYCQKCTDGECADDDDAGNSDEVCVGAGTECDICQSGECEDSCPTGCCGGECCEPPVITSISGPTDVDICEEANYSHSSNDPDGTTLSYSWTGGGTPPTGSSSNFTTKWACIGEETASLTVTDNDCTECCGSGECCEDKIDSDSKDTEVTLPSGCSLAGPHDSSIEWLTPFPDDYLSRSITDFGLFEPIGGPSGDYNFRYTNCSWKCEVSNVKSYTTLAVRDPADLTDDVGAPYCDYWCYDAVVAHEEQHRVDWQECMEDKWADAVILIESLGDDIDCSDSTTITCGAAASRWTTQIKIYEDLALLYAEYEYDDPLTPLQEDEVSAYEASYLFDEPISSALPGGCTP